MKGHAPTKAGDGAWSCTCGLPLPDRQSAIRAAMREHRTQLEDARWAGPDRGGRDCPEWQSFIAAAPARFTNRISPDPTTGCWEWFGPRDRHGYGVMTWNHAGVVFNLAHRLAVHIAGGALRDELVLDHLCRNRRCVNPSHLEQVPQSENVTRGLRKTHCKRGHSLADAYISGSRRECRPCRIQRERNKRARVKEAA